MQRPAGCDDFRRSLRFTRRSALEAGWLGACGLALPGLWQRQAMANVGTAGPGFGKAKRCILLFMWGGPSQLDTWDMKPDAPEEIRGDFKPIATSVPGTQISEHFPKLAGLAQHYSIIRSMTHDDVAHLSSAHHALTGIYAPKRFSDADPPSSADTPHIGSVLAKLDPSDRGVPSFVMMPWIVSHPAAPGGKAPGQHGGWLGRAHDPFLVGDPNAKDFQIPGCRLPEDVGADRLLSRQQLLGELESQSTGVGAPGWRDMTDRAVSLISRPETQSAFDIAQEPDAVRDRYGRNTHGQCILLARRLAEAGVPLVTVNWHDDGQNFWDTHGKNFIQLKDRLMPPADQAFSALLEDLVARGMLEDTLVVWVGEFGRRPQISREHAGREHWARCYSAVLAGGGITGGGIYGRSDRIAAYPAENPVSPSDLVATMYHALGFSTDLTLPDRQQIPKHLITGQPILPLFS